MVYLLLCYTLVSLIVYYDIGYFVLNMFCVPESFNKNILNQLIDYKITFVNSLLENTNSKGDFIPENWFKMFV